MINHIDFYFDIISPYAYIAHKKILKHKNITFNYKPIFCEVIEQKNKDILNEFEIKGTNYQIRNGEYG